MQKGHNVALLHSGGIMEASMKHNDSESPAWLQMCAAGELDPFRRMAARRAILSHSQAQDCTVYRSDAEDEDAEEEDLGDARILFVGPFQAPESWSETERSEFFDELDPQLFVTALIECEAPAHSSSFFLADIGDYVATMTAGGQVEMFFVHDCREDDQGRLCVLVRDEEPLF
jgi:hypothetical protein